MFATYFCARFQSCYKESYWSAYKRIFRYLTSTIGHRLWYPPCIDFDLFAYGNLDHGGCKIDRKTTFDTCHSLGE